MFTDTGVLRVIAAFAAAVTVVGAAVMRRWDGEAGKQVADLTRARAGDEWRHEERAAELETDLEESRELRVKLEQKLRAKRSELQGLRNEHAALLRRYATAETERASALEGRRLLELEASGPQDADVDTDVDADADTDVDVKPAAAKGAARVLPAGSGESVDPADEVEETDSDAAALDAAAAGVSAALGAVGARTADVTEDTESVKDTESQESPAAPAIFSPAGSSLFLRARAALARFDGEVPAKAAPAPAPAVVKIPAEVSGPAGSDGPDADKAEAAREDEAKGKSEAARGHTRAAATPAEAKPAKPVRGFGHYTVPTAVAVVPTTEPLRRPAVPGGFDFFGTEKEEASAALDAVQNEDLADVVGQEALALHKAESEAQFKPVDEESRGVGIGQVIDLTAHDETEQIDLQGLRSAVS
ncbi:hypothetical protein GCM10023084_53050 [Streptomyces lacrimifluminis]|uniref:Secreted protein n=1 Tax=Streptomyces lacrimifluminis TaxID=1500077 RepID=A0A917LA35_9ACTN|nr:hypothetical protein GCM10012282_60170 [Streptomyces lacrimifluminis]